AARVDYTVAVDPETLVAGATLRMPVLLAAAVYFGPTRLIDNILVT
ncbi:MAG: pantoate--beta-alanine ligase, partial [Verrucomicrobia bacterium]|nr:pantoate--beta-alanine ligase [Verrucomicrobiota bacterium]